MCHDAYVYKKERIFKKGINFILFSVLPLAIFYTAGMWNELFYTGTEYVTR